MVKTFRNILLQNLKSYDLELGMQHRGIKLYKVCINGGPGLTLTYFTARSNLETWSFLWEKVQTVDFSETIVACDLKVGRCRQLIDFMKVCEYLRSMSFLDLGPRPFM